MSVEFKVPADFAIQQSPQNLPPVYNGDKMVVYGILTPKGSLEDKEITGKVILKGQVPGKKLEHSIPFTFNPAATSCPSLPTIHHLAAKALIKDWQDQGKKKEEIVKLSVESSVISSHTAFIAVDEESSEPVTGAMKMWDIQASMLCDNSLYSSDSSSFEQLDEIIEYCDEEDEFENNHESLHLRSTMKTSFAPKCLGAAPPVLSATVTKTSEILTYIITAQQVDGSWKLDSSVIQLLAKPQNEVENGCPVKCNKSIASIWATVLILTLLQKKYSSQQNEWELIAMKAESWVKKQALPSGLTVKELYSAANLLI